MGDVLPGLKVVIKGSGDEIHTYMPVEPGDPDAVVTNGAA